jgi:Protein of unknown function (DUF4435)
VGLDPRAVCHIQIANNRSNVLRVVSILDNGSFEGHLGLIDHDFSKMLSERIASRNIILTDENDVEVMIFVSDVFERFIIEYASPDKINAVEGEKGMSIRDVLILSASVVGTLRYLSRKLDWRLNFEDMTYRFTRRDDIEIDLDRQIEHLRGRSQGTPMPLIDEVKRHISAAGAGGISDKLPYVCGHDLCGIISKGVHKVFGRAHTALGAGGVAVEEVFRTSYTLENFRKSSIYKRLKDWETANRPYRVLFSE